MTTSAKVIADSASPQGGRLTTLQLRYPRFIHSEFMTHRAFSRNASSSRAIPVERLIRDVLDDPVEPSFWGKNRRDAWAHAREGAVRMARAFAKAGYHKQIVNRLLEPFCHINAVVTATQWSNFFALRIRADAQPKMRMLAEAMQTAMNLSTPRLLRPGEWHLPYFDSEKDDVGNWLGSRCKPIELAQETCIKISVARCARVSYLTQDGKKPTIEEDMALHDRLLGAQPIHASPAEHQATPDDYDDLTGWAHPHLHGNLRGWCQFRKTLPGERQ